MKKYIITGMAALTMGCTFTSCSHDTDFDENAVQENIVQTYETAFIKAFGQPAPTQTWGFGPISTARTRSNPGENYNATSTGINANANEWADPNKYFGGWIVPDPLTEGQKARVKAYFQANPKLTYEDPHYRHFFVQQVYKGGPTTAGSNSTEVVTAANGSEYDSDNMNLLTVGKNAQHINNFNAGTCSTNTNVLSNEGNANDGPFHSDEIMLMVNIDDTSCFGYHETGSSNESDPTGQHNDRAALVSAAVIDAWAAANGNPGEKVVDKWNRSFIGFDLAIKEGDQIFTGGKQSYTEDMFMGFSNFYYGDENIVSIYEYEDPTHANNNWTLKLKDEYKGASLKDGHGNEIKQLISNTNFFSGELIEVDESNLKINIQDGSGEMLNMKWVTENLIDEGYYPVSGSAFKTWVKPTPSYDLYYSDWIVTLTEAQRNPNAETPTDPNTPTPTTPSSAAIRVIAEDLTISDVDNEGNKAKTDFDFNDVVFDVDWTSSGATITLLAAGGTLPLVVGVDPTANSGWERYEVHYLFGVATNIMVNTNFRKGVSRSAVTYDITGSFGENAANIPVFVQKGGEWIELTANQGKPASKIGVSTSYNWCDEREAIDSKYPDFSSWVTNGDPVIWW